MRRWISCGLLGIFFLLPATPARGGVPAPRAVGVLVVTREVSRAYTADYHQREAYAEWPLGALAPPGGWRAVAAVRVAAGRIASSGDHAITGSVGPAFSLAAPGGRLVLNTGIRPAYLSNHHLGRLELGMHVQFISHLGVLVRLADGLMAGWCLQHLSNAGMDHANPGINLATVEVRLAW